MTNKHDEEIANNLIQGMEKCMNHEGEPAWFSNLFTEEDKRSLTTMVTLDGAFAVPKSFLKIMIAHNDSFKESMQKIGVPTCVVDEIGRALAMAPIGVLAHFSKFSEAQVEAQIEERKKEMESEKIPF